MKLIPILICAVLALFLAEPAIASEDSIYKMELHFILLLLLLMALMFWGLHRLIKKHTAGKSRVVYWLLVILALGASFVTISALVFPLFLLFLSVIDSLSLW